MDYYNARACLEAAPGSITRLLRDFVDFVCLVPLVGGFLIGYGIASIRLLGYGTCLDIHSLGNWDSSMIKLCIIGFAFLLVGCSTSTQERVSLTEEQAREEAVRLANAKATELYHCRPFTDRQPANFSQGRWIWSDRQGFSQGDIEATVALAANGATNSVDVKLLDNRPNRTPLRQNY
jgi:hypothetical protein